MANFFASLHPAWIFAGQIALLYGAMRLILWLGGNE